MNISIKGLLIVLAAAFALAAVFWIEDRRHPPPNPRVEAEFKRESDCRTKAEQVCPNEDRRCTLQAVIDCTAPTNGQ